MVFEESTLSRWPALISANRVRGVWSMSGPLGQEPPQLPHCMQRTMRSPPGVSLTTSSRNARARLSVGAMIINPLRRFHLVLLVRRHFLHDMLGKRFGGSRVQCQEAGSRGMRLNFQSRHPARLLSGHGAEFRLGVANEAAGEPADLFGHKDHHAVAGAGALDDVGRADVPV